VPLRISVGSLTDEHEDADGEQDDPTTIEAMPPTPSHRTVLPRLWPSASSERLLTTKRCASPPGGGAPMVPCSCTVSST
jgi:hypothetical protein